MIRIMKIRPIQSLFFGLFVMLASCVFCPHAAQGYYNPSTGRWLSRDGLDESGGPNLNGFVQNDAVRLIDYVGLCCCCCAEFLSIEGVRTFKTPWVFGHLFKLQVGMYYPGEGTTAKGCTLKWIETIVEAGRPTKGPSDVMIDAPTSDQARFWRERKELCGTTETVSIPDAPALDRSGWHRVRTVDFEFILESSPDCACSSKSIKATAKQVLTLDNGVMDWDHSSFTTD